SFYFNDYYCFNSLVGLWMESRFIFSHGLWLVNNLGYWNHLVDTLSLVVISVVIAIIIGVPVGIWMSQKNTAQAIITPILDFMQTMPAFVYLIPAVVFFKLGVVPGVVSTVIF